MEKQLYEEFLRRKNDGEVLDFDSISTVELGTLSAKEFVSEQDIATLFNVSKYKVNKKRNEFGLTQGHRFDTIHSLAIELAEMCNTHDMRVIGDWDSIGKEIYSYVLIHGFVKNLEDILPELPITRDAVAKHLAAA